MNFYTVQPNILSDAWESLKGISIISIAIDAPQDIISTLSGKIGRLKGVSVKTAYSNVVSKEN